MASRDGLWAYRDRFEERFGRTYFRRFGDGVISSIGLGTYLGEPTDAVDERYEETIVGALEGGINLVDTAITYRMQRSERCVGRALRAASTDRSSVVIATKGGFLPFDGTRPADPAAYIRSEFVETGRVDPAELVAGSHCIAPAFIDEQVERSLENLTLETIDLYYVHNPETQLRERSTAAVYETLEATFERLERRVAAGDLGAYGVATWSAFRVPSDDPRHLSLPEIVRRARAAATAADRETTGLAAIQLPFNVHMADAFTVEAHQGPAGPQSALAFARDAGLAVFTSASLAQGDLVDGLPKTVASRIEGGSPAQRAITFARSAPGVTASLVGMSRRNHLEENLEAGRYDPMGASTFDRVFE